MADDTIYLPTARQLLQEVASRGLHLVDCVVLLPNLQVAAPLTRALVAASGQPWLLPPRWLTLPAWAETAGTGQPLMPESRRLALLYQHLRGRQWFDDDSLWPVCRELAQLFDDLTLQLVGLPEDPEHFEEQVTRAYQSRRQQGIALEAALVHDMWYAVMRPSPGDAQPAALRYVMQLARLTQTTDSPVFTFGLGQLNRAEQECLDRIARHSGVVRLVVPEMRPGLDLVWPASEEMGLAERAEAWRALAGPWAKRMHFTAARNLEHEARCAAWQIRDWLASGLGQIAVIVQDRQTARRLRAMLEREQVLVRDETGWTLDTTVAAALVMRWLDAIAQDFSADDLRNLLGGLPVEPETGKVAHQFERLRARHPATQGLSDWLALAASDARCAGLHGWLERLQRAQARLAGTSRSQSAWLQLLLDSLASLGLTDWLTVDEAGYQLWTLLLRLMHELDGHAMRLTLAEFHHWLADELSAQSFVDDRVDSPVLFTHLTATRMRRFDGVLFLGADQTTLRPVSAGGVFFNQRVRSSLGLPGPEIAVDQLRADLISLLGLAEQVRVLWTSEQRGEVRQVASWFVRYNLVNRLAGDASCFDEQLAYRADSVSSAEPDGLPVAPRPPVLNDLLPERISVSNLGRLVSCPYRYFAAAILGLQGNEPDDPGVRKQDYGQLLHQILHRFHAGHPSITALGRGAAREALIAQSEDVFAPLIERDRQASGWLQRWLDRVDSYLDWQREREAAGWSWQAGEQDVQRQFVLADGGLIELHGRIDRIDVQGDGLALLDYKTSALDGLRQAAEQPDEDVQLAAYAVLLDGQPVTESAFLALDVETGVRSVPVQNGLPAAVDCLENRMVSIFARLRAGDGLPANGASSTCDRCEFSGLCRRPAWQPDCSDFSSA